MNEYNETSEVLFVVKTNRTGSTVEETLTLEELGWEGQQGDELEEFLQSAYRDWVWENIDGSVNFVDEY